VKIYTTELGKGGYKEYGGPPIATVMMNGDAGNRPKGG
jgi:hypothetical protein